MSVDFSQFFNGPIRDSLIAQVSGYLDISRQQATTAYDKAVALVIGAMARQAGKPEGAQELAAHIKNSQTQSSLTSSALSPTVLTNDQFAQIVTLGHNEQAIILGPQQEAVTSHLEVATGLDTKAVGSLLSIVVPFVLSFLKNNITTESAPAQSLPLLLATQAPHVAAQLDAPALAALGEDSLEGLFGADALAATAGSNTAVASSIGKQGATQGASATARPANGWFKWVLTLAVVLAGAAWIKSCTQSDTTKTENAKPADQQQAATDAPAPDAATAPAATSAPAQADAPAATAGDNRQETHAEAATEPSAHFPEPAPAQSAGGADASPASEEAQTDRTQAGSTKQDSTQAENADTPVTPLATADTQSADTAAPASGQPASEQPSTARGQADMPATDKPQADAAATSAPQSAAAAANTDSTNDSMNGPTYGQASDSMEADAPPAASGEAAGSAVTDAARATEQTATSPAQDTTDTTQPEATGADNEQADQASAAQDATAATAAPDASSPATEQAAADSATSDVAAAGGAAAKSATTDSATTDSAVPGKTTTFADAAPIANQPDAASAAPTPEPAGAAGKTTTFAESDPSDGQTQPAQPQEANAGQAGHTQTDAATSSDGATPSTTAPAPSGKTTTFGAETQDNAASISTAPADSAATTADNAGQPSAAATDRAQDAAVARVELERDGEVLMIRGTVPDEAARNRILSAAKFVDGHSKIEDELQVNSQAAASTFDDYSGLLSVLRGYHDVSVSLAREALTLTGQVSSNEEKAALTGKVQNLVGAKIQVNNQTQVAQTPRSTVTDTPVATAAPPQVQFASGSAQVDSRFHEILDQYAQQLKENGKSVQLIGFADESGSQAGNDALSKRRAESVKAYLILRGVQTQQIQTEGQGAQAPVADNTTEAGRAKNRRVEIHEQ